MSWQHVHQPPWPVWWFAKRNGTQLGGYTNTPQGLSAVCRNLADWDLYTQLNPAPRKKALRVSSQDVSIWTTVMVDLDPMEAGTSPEEAMQAALAEAQQYLGIGLHPTVLDTGRGMQAWIRFAGVSVSATGPLPTGANLPPRGAGLQDGTALTRHTVRWATRHFLLALNAAVEALGWRVDAVCADLARLGRMPGTVNHRTRRPVVVVSTGELHGGEVPHTLLMRSPPAPEVQHVSPIGGPVQRVWSLCTERARTFIERGVSEGERHMSAWHTAHTLKELGVERSEAERLLLSAASRCIPALRADDALRCVRQAYGG